MWKLWVSTLALCVGVASITHASSVTRYKVKGNTAGGGIATVEDPCFNASLSVSGFEGVTRDGSTTAETKELNVNFFGSDNCQSLGYSAFAFLPLTVPVTGSTVTFTFDVMVDVYSLETYETVGQKRLVGSATVSTNGNGNPVKSRWTTVTQTETTRQTVRLKGMTRDASFAATATLDDVPLNFDPATESANVGTNAFGTIEVIRN
jgi:hypothetical protein